MTTDVEVVITTFEAGRADITHVRDTVFIQEQGIAADEEYDQYDPHCSHVVLRCDDRPVATGRLHIEPWGGEPQGEPVGRFGRIAVLAAYRGLGLGQRVVVELERLSLAAGLSKVWFHAQTYAQPFYERLGYRASGAVFLEEGIPHVHMSKRLDG
jgi:predicted GNAT family N-acyltransferase